MKLIRDIARYIVGLLFIVSGLIKINDPVGTAIKLEEYFEVFASDISPVFMNLVPAALFLSVFLSVLELVLGVALLLRYRLKAITTLLLIIIVFFTFLTFYSAYFNKVTDCGCFGDALKLTPWQSFGKDIILLVLIVFLFISYLKMPNRFAVQASGLWVMLSAIAGLVLALVAIFHLPFIDFRAYKVGTNIPAAMLPSERYQYSYVMEKNGKIFELDHYPDASEGYTFKEMITLNPEAAPKIVDFAIWDDGQQDLTEEILSGNQLLIFIQNAEGANAEALQKIRNLATALNKSIRVKAITSIGPAAYKNFRQTQNFKLPYAYADGTLIKTIIRSNPGIMLLEQGTVVGKWHYNDIPNADEIKSLLRSK